MYEKINEIANSLKDELVKRRIDFHKYPELGWLEIRTASIIARELNNLGYKVLVGKEVCDEKSRMGLPLQEEFDKNYNRAIEQGADVEFAKLVKDGYTGVIGVLENGEGPVVALRFDIDALPIVEDATEGHKPTKEGFVSCNIGCMHACGHDGHGTIGLGVAKTLMEIKDSLKGTVKLIFQPAEEGVRGAKSIVEKGHLDDVDYLIGAHIGGVDAESCQLTPGMNGALATTKLDVYFKGFASHAGGSPEKGKNVMLSLSTAILNLYAIPRHSGGATRINVGTVQAGTGRNVIADSAKLEIEIRGETTEINKYMEDYAVNIINAAATMHGTTVEVKKVGNAIALDSSDKLIDRIRRVCSENVPDIKITEFNKAHLGGSEDFSFMADRVQGNGKEATFMLARTPITAIAHNCQYDFDEHVLVNGVKIYSSIVYDICKK